MESGAPPGGAHLPPRESRAGEVIAVTASTTAIAIVLTLLRGYVRVRMIKLLGWDDYFNFFSTACSAAVCGLLVASTYYGLGQHVEYVDLNRSFFALELSRIAQFLTILSTMTFKNSVGVFLTRFFTQSKSWKWTVWALVGLNAITSIIVVVLIFTQCRPVAKLWAGPFVTGWCLPWAVNKWTVIAQGIMAASTDFILAGLPVVFLWDVKIKRSRKVAICFVMSLGVVSGVTAIIRTALVDDLRNPTDPTWEVVPTFIWATIDANLGIITATLPTLAPMLSLLDSFKAHVHSKPLTRRWWGSRTAKSSSSNTEVGAAATFHETDSNRRDKAEMLELGDVDRIHNTERSDSQKGPLLAYWADPFDSARRPRSIDS